ncbi:MAG TPA: T9SS type A sorting domain-containing protein, partial [Bacteroidetes bacterium]|nr:T9SS type A sorting domain-containing protein [Bacteroidota bacterium]
TQLSDWTHYAEVAQAIDMSNLILQDDADGVFASNTAYERAVEVGDPWDNEIYGIGYKRTPFEDMDDHDPASVDVVGKVGDFVWEDKDGDGLQDPGEPGIEGVIIELHNCDPNSGIAVQYDTTDANGAYLFDMVIPGMYYVKFNLPGDYEFTLDNVGPNDNIDSDVDGTNGFGTTECFEVEANEEQLDIDAGAYICVPVGDLVWLDYNRNNVYDSDENGVNGLKVELYRYTDDEWVLWDYDYTGIDPRSVCGDGFYYFCTNPGTYFLRFVTPPTGLVPAQPHKGGDPTKDSDITRAHDLGTTNTFYLTSGTDGDLTLDAGYYEMASIINSMAWIDENQNGLREPNEAALPNMGVELYDANGELYNSTVTDQTGHYQLDYLQAEDYYLKFIIPSDYSTSYGFTAGNQGDDTIDSDVTNSNGTGTTEMFGLVPEQQKEFEDAGIAEGTLPLNYLSVGAKWDDDHSLVYWATANEQNIVKFIVQRSYSDNGKFEQVGEVVAKDGSSNNYEFEDYDNFKNGVYYYRIVEVDADGLVTKSKIVPVFVSKGFDHGIVEVYPNPVVDEASIKFVNKSNAMVNISLMDISGKVAIANIVNEEMSIGNYEVRVNVSNLKPATYYLKVEAGDDVMFKKVVVLNK